jgi:hypothetical protein
MTDANTQVTKTRAALTKLEGELRSEGEIKQANAILTVLRSEMSVLRLAAILAPSN